MRHQLKSLLVLLVIFGLAFGNLIGPAMAKDLLINAEITDVVLDKDVNGNDFARIIVKEQKTMNGVKYEKGTPCMAFIGTVGEAGIATAKALKPGMNLRAVVSEREYQGRTSYTILAFAK
jgi:hypothetical protein